MFSVYILSLSSEVDFKNFEKSNRRNPATGFSFSPIPLLLVTSFDDRQNLHLVGGFASLVLSWIDILRVNHIGTPIFIFRGKF